MWATAAMVTLAQGRPPGIVRSAPAGEPGGLVPALVAGGVIVLVAGLVAAWIVLRRRARRTRGPETARPSLGALPTLARAMKIGRSEVRVLKRLASAADVREPAVLLISEYAFRNAAARVMSDSPEARDAVAALAESLGYDLRPATRDPRAPGPEGR